MCKEKLSINIYLMKFNWTCSVTMLSIIYILLTYLRTIIPRKRSSLYLNKVTVKARQKNLMQTCSKWIVSQEMYLHKACKWTRSVVRVPGYSVIIVSDQYRLSLPASIPTSVWANHSLPMPFMSIDTHVSFQYILFAGQTYAMFLACICVNNLFSLKFQQTM